MPTPPEHSRIDIVALKSQIARLGPDRSYLYFNSLNRLLALKLSKQEFQRSCLSTLGRENLVLHNQLVLAILKNACLAKEPPPASPPEPNCRPTVKKSLPNKHSVATPASVKLNGDILPPSPRKVRTGARRIKDRPSPLGPNGRAEVDAHHNSAPCEEVLVRANCGLSPSCDLKKRRLQHLEAGGAEQLHKQPCIGHISDRQLVHNKSVAFSVPEKEEGQCPLRAPLGIPFCHASVGGARRPLPSQVFGNFSCFNDNYDTGELCSTEDLKERMERIAETQGLGAVRVECANLLNNGIDAYLKRLIKSCVELVVVNSVWPESHIQQQGSSSCVEGLHEHRDQHLMSLHDFKVAMELNPQQLGEDWPLLLEKVSIQSFRKEGR